ncbi:hypothetical protein PM082_012525 [Marasmius tenuissimus]|nr:hypothetical protein PM082_012525 [Marasmius tenuissimus]
MYAEVITFFFFGDGASYLSWPFSIVSFCSHVLLTSLIAGRIFYISRQVTKYGALRVSRMYKTIIAACLESGLIYPVDLLIYTASSLALSAELRGANGEVIPTASTIFPEVSYSLMIPVMGIASTLIIVRTALGIAINNQESFKTNVLGEMGAGENTGDPPGLVDSVIDIRRSTRELVERRRDEESVA